MVLIDDVLCDTNAPDGPALAEDSVGVCLDEDCKCPICTQDASNTRYLSRYYGGVNYA